MNNTPAKKWYIIIIIAVIITMISVVGWIEYRSYTDVTFMFDDKKGQAELASTKSGRINIQDRQTLRLKKGEYTLSVRGEHIEQSSKLIQIDDSSHTMPVIFNYTSSYLQHIYSKERSAIRSTLLKEYPRIRTLYSVSGGAVYQKGQYFGAKLTHRQKKSEHRDSLRVLMKKDDSGKWRVLSHPPAPVLSAPDYPDVQRDTLESINRVK